MRSWESEPGRTSLYGRVDSEDRMDQKTRMTSKGFQKVKRSLAMIEGEDSMPIRDNGSDQE